MLLRSFGDNNFTAYKNLAPPSLMSHTQGIKPPSMIKIISVVSIGSKQKIKHLICELYNFLLVLGL